jgi:hypothetical protein
MFDIEHIDLPNYRMIEELDGDLTLSMHICPLPGRPPEVQTHSRVSSYCVMNM